MRWEAITGHCGVIKILKNMLASGRVPHAVLFVGPAGLGKMLVARTMAASLLCSGDSVEKPCGVCPACRKIDQGAHPDLVILPSDGTSLKIDQIRALQHEVALAPYYGERRVFIIEEAERLTAQAANSLLKVLEEPPAGTVFILTAASPYALLPTIVSRCRTMSFHPLSAEMLASLLLAKGADPVKAAVAARLGGGRVGSALTLLSEDGLASRDRAAEIIAALSEGGAELVWETAATLDKLEAASLQLLLVNLSYVLRDLLVVLAGQDGLILNLDIAAKLKDIAVGWDEVRLSQALDAIKQAGRALETNANARLTCEALLIKLMDAAKEGKKDANCCRHTV